MKYNELNVAPKKNRKRVGRGIAAGQGKTAGRGTKGQGSRTGKKLLAIFQGGQRQLVQAVPKNRGFKSKRTPAQVVYLDRLADTSKKSVDNFELFEAGLIQTPFHTVKVIARGELKKAINLETQGASKAVKDAVVAAGGTFKKVPTPLPKSTKEAEKADK